MNQLSAWLPQHDLITWTTVAAAALLGGMLRGLTGFGAALVMAPLMSVVLSARETLCVVTVLCALPLGQSLSRRIIRLADRAVLVPMIAASVIGMPGGVWLISRLPAHLFGSALGVVVICSAIALLAGASVPGRGSRSASAGVGLLSGVLTGFGGIGGPPAILYVLGMEPDPARARANFLVFFACIYPLALVVVTVLGVMTWPALFQGLLLAPLLHVGGMMGTYLFTTMNKRFFRPSVLMLLVIAGGLASFPRTAHAHPIEIDTPQASPSWCGTHCCSATDSSPVQSPNHNNLLIFNKNICLEMNLQCTNTGIVLAR